MSYVYIRRSHDNDEWVAGFFMPDDTFARESKHDSPEAAARRVNYLNGGAPDIGVAVRQILGDSAKIRRMTQ